MVEVEGVAIWRQFISQSPFTFMSTDLDIVDDESAEIMRDYRRRRRTAMAIAILTLVTAAVVSFELAKVAVRFAVDQVDYQRSN